MFSKRSRYSDTGKITTVDDRGNTIVAVKLRRLGDPSARPVAVTQGDQLDVMCHQRYRDGARYWHVADANSELEATALVLEPGRVIQVPER